MSAAFDETAVTRGLRDGNREAWGALYREYSVRVWRYASRLIGNDQSAVADVVQESFLAAAQSAATFDPERGTLWNWLAGITHNKASRYWQRAARRSESSLDVNHAKPPDRSDHQSPERVVQSQELAEQVRGTLAGLPAEYAGLLSAKHIDGLSTAELQALFGGTSDAVRSKLVRARREFRDAFLRLTGTEWDSVESNFTFTRRTAPNT